MSYTHDIFDNSFPWLGDGYVRQMWGYLWSELLKAVSTEPEPEVKVLLMESCARVCRLQCSLQFLKASEYFARI